MGITCQLSKPKAALGRASDEDTTVAAVEVRDIGFEPFRSQLQQLVARIGGGTLDRIADGDGDPTGGGERVERRGLGVATDECHGVGSHPQHLGGDLHHGGAGTAADLAHPGDQVYRPIFVELDPGPRPSPAAQPPFAAGQPTADAFAGLTRQRFPPTGGLGRTIQRLPHPDMAQSNASARGPALTHAVAAPKLDRVDAELAADDIDLGFSGEVRLDAPWAAERPAPHLVGVDAIGLKPHMRDVVGATNDGRGDLGAAWMTGKAGIEVHQCLPGHQHTVLV